MRPSNEFWRDIEDCPGYIVSNQGRIWNTKLNREVKGSFGPSGNKVVSLYDRNGKAVGRSVAQLVAKTFIPEYRPRTHIKHFDEDPDNNSVYNLRFTSGYKTGDPLPGRERIGARHIKATPLDKGSSKVFRTIHDCARYLKMDASTIYKVLRGERDHHRGYVFEYIYVTN